MSGHTAARVAGTISAVIGFIIIATTQALAAFRDVPGSGGPPLPSSPETRFEIFGLAWQPALALAIALVAVGGLLYSIQHHRHGLGQHV